jgi:hypothetical protein
MTTYITLFNLTDAGIICDVAKCSGFREALRSPEVDSWWRCPPLSSFIAGVASARVRCSGRQLLRENVDRMDLGAPVEQFLGPAEQGGGDGALKMRLAGLIAAEAVKDSERPLIDPEGVPGNRAGLLGNETEGACKKRGDLFLLPRLCLQTHG